MTAFTELVGCAMPLQLAGMGAVGADARLPAAVSQAGGLGMLGAAGVSVGRLAALLHEMDAATDRPFGVNFLMPFLDREAVALASRRCRVVDLMYGDPDPELVELVHTGGALACWQVGSRAEAVEAERAGCDLVVVQGTEAGGHVRGKQPLAELLREALGAVSVPVLAAGGIGTAEDVGALLDAGAAGVRVGTRFLAADESVAHPAYVDALIGAEASDTVLTETFAFGWPDAPHRVLQSAVQAALEADEQVGTTAGGSPVPRFSTAPPTQDVSGNIGAMPLYAGTSVSAVTRRASAAEIVAELFPAFAGT